MPPRVPPNSGGRGSKSKAQGAFHEENSTHFRRSYRPSGGPGSGAKSAGTEAIAGGKLAAEHAVAEVERRPGEGPEGQPVPPGPEGQPVPIPAPGYDRFVHVGPGGRAEEQGRRQGSAGAPWREE